eukprot:5792745-Pyramimonas_sp.AAC.1
MARGSSSTTTTVAPTTAALTTPLTTPSTAPRLQEATTSARATSGPSAHASPQTSTTSEGAARDALGDDHALDKPADDRAWIRRTFVPRAISDNQFGIASSLELAEALSSNGARLIFGREFTTKSLDTDAHASSKRVNTIASKRMMKAFRRSHKLQKLISAGAKVGGILRAGSLAKALWGSGVSGLSMKQLLGLRLSTVQSLHKDKKRGLHATQGDAQTTGQPAGRVPGQASQA